MTFKDMVNDAITTTGVGHAVDTLQGLDVDSDEAKIASFMRKAQLDVSRKLPNMDLKFTGALTTVARVSLATTSVTNGSSAVTLNASGIAGYVGRLFNVQGDKATYRVKSVDGTALVLADLAGAEANYEGTTNTTATAEIAQDRYKLPANFKMPHSLNHFWGPGVMEYRSPERFDALRFDDATTFWTVSDPSYFTIFSVEMVQGEPQHLVHFWTIPKNAKSYPFKYEGSPTLMRADSDVSGYHPEYEQAIITRTRYYIYRFILRDDTQMQIELGEWRDIFNDQRKNPITQTEAPTMVPETGAAYWEDAY